jgi:hypothetical protein
MGARTIESGDANLSRAEQPFYLAELPALSGMQHTIRSDELAAERENEVDRGPLVGDSDQFLTGDLLRDFGVKAEN